MNGRIVIYSRVMILKQAYEYTKDNDMSDEDAISKALSSFGNGPVLVEEHETDLGDLEKHSQDDNYEAPTYDDPDTNLPDVGTGTVLGDTNIPDTDFDASEGIELFL